MKKLIYFLILIQFALLSCAHKVEAPAAEPPAVIQTANATTTDLSPTLTRYEAQKRLLAISTKPDQYAKIEKNSKEFSVMLFEKGTSGDRNNEWQDAHAKVFYKNPNKVDQISVVVETCNAPESVDLKVELQDRLRKLVRLVSEKVLGAPFDLPSEGGYFKELGPYWKTSVQVPVRESYSMTKSMRISRGMYKCDGRGGFGFRYDFILK